METQQTLPVDGGGDGLSTHPPVAYEWVETGLKTGRMPSQRRTKGLAGEKDQRPPETKANMTNGVEGGKANAHNGASSPGSVW